MKENIKILIAEDNLINQEVIVAIIEGLGFKYDVANDGTEAFEKFIADDYDIILTDLHMPNMDGLALIKEIRKMETDKRDIPIVVITADYTIESKQELFKAGATDYCTKPIELKKITKIIDKILKSQIK